MICFFFSLNYFIYLFTNAVFLIYFFLDSIVMVSLNCNNQKHL